MAAPAKGNAPRLRRELSLSGAVALSVGLMGPTMAMNLNPAQPATLVGSAVPLVFLLAMIGVALVAYSFVRLAQRFNHAGSVYAFAGATLGPRTGFVAGWALLATYVAFTCVTITGTGIFGAALLGGDGWIPVTALAVVAGLALTLREVRMVTRALLTVEGFSIALILLLATVILVDVIGGGGPAGQDFSLDAFSPSGLALGDAALAVVFGFLSFAGFEAAATLDEETRRPRRDIPLAMGGTVLAVGLFYLLATLAQAEGFGVGAGAEAYGASSSLFGDLGDQYIGAWMADVVNAGAMLSAFGCALGCITAGSRLLFAMGRDGFPSPAVGRVSHSGAPYVAILAVTLVAALIVAALRIVATDSARDIFFWMSTMGTFPLLVAYMCTTAGAIRLLFFRERAVPRWEIAIPLAALAFLGYVLWKNLSPVPDHPYNLFPYITAAWLVAGVAITVAVPGLTRRIGAHLALQQA